MREIDRAFDALSLGGGRRETVAKVKRRIGPRHDACRFKSGKLLGCSRAGTEDEKNVEERPMVVGSHTVALPEISGRRLKSGEAA